MIQGRFRRWVLPALFIASVALCARAEDWRPVEKELLSKATPSVDSTADVEGIFWEVWVSDVDTGGEVKTQLKHYIRLKVFTERGKDYVKQVEIRYSKNLGIRDVEARTIKPDGTVVELDKNSIVDQALASSGRVNLRSRSFALPAVAPGVVVEYRWKEERPLQDYSRFYLQRDIPMQSIAYHIKPFTASWMPFGMNSAVFNMPNVRLQKESGGYYGLNLYNVPAFKTEPLMPPEDSVRAFLLVFYNESTPADADAYWKAYGREGIESMKLLLKPNGDIKKAVAEAVGASTEPDEVIEKLYRYVQSKVKNVNTDASGITARQREKTKKNNQPSDTLKRGVGTSTDILELFASMATGAGFDARIALTGDRSDYFFTPTYADDYFLNNPDVAIKVNGQWKIYDPSAPYADIGMLNWGEEDNYALIPDAKRSVFITTPLTPAGKTVEKRSAKLVLGEDGTLEGDVIIEYSGHRGAELKELNDNLSATEREEKLKKELQQRLGTAEITQIQIDNVTDHQKPYTCRFHIKASGYAQHTGKRFFFQPAFFQKGIEPLFQSSQRKYSVYFHYPWSEIDDVQIALPPGYEVEKFRERKPIDVGVAGKHELRFTVSEDHKSITCTRNFFFGSKSNILYPVDKYQPLKELFDDIHEADNTTLTLKAVGAP
jgi:hypothetical protein